MVSEIAMHTRHACMRCILKFPFCLLSCWWMEFFFYYTGLQEISSSSSCHSRYARESDSDTHHKSKHDLSVYFVTVTGHFFQVFLFCCCAEFWHIVLLTNSSLVVGQQQHIVAMLSFEQLQLCNSATCPTDREIQDPWLGMIILLFPVAAASAHPLPWIQEMQHMRRERQSAAKLKLYWMTWKSWTSEWKTKKKLWVLEEAWQLHTRSMVKVVQLQRGFPMDACSL